ncbi:MAG: hypothetical protein PHV33_06805 [Elusimicrobiales bacterium]|nr:hypothetical protein [Elusimicrobiales bacterium]
MKKILELAAAFGRGALPKDIEYKYIYTPPVSGEGAGAVCVG